MHHLKHLTVLLTTSLTLTAAIPVASPAPQNGALLGGAIGGILNTVANLPVISNLAGNSVPPLMTSDHSEECLDVNQGTLMCCKNTLDGGNAAVQFLSTLAGYSLTKDTINGILCDETDECVAPSEKLCCQVVAFTPLLAMYCAQAS